MNMPDKPHLKMDWTINIGQLVALLLFILSGIAAWYDVKTEVKVNRTESDSKFKQVDEFIQYQRKTDKVQDEQRERLSTELKDALKESSRDIKSDIRDLRNDIIRKR